MAGEKPQPHADHFQAAPGPRGLLKADIEGAEKPPEDVAGWSGQVRDVLLEVHHNVDAREAAALMAAHGFRMTGQDDMNRTELWFSK